ncbi:MAG: restriction endonuclease subunit S [Thaumarchaeota archaeon]|nr:restriction endonuclease subunit S [Nitrososphaerota archaeon]
MKSNKLGLLTTKIGSGITPRGGQSVYQDSGTHLIRSQNIYNHKFKKNGLVCISQEIAEKMKSVEIIKEDVLINITGDSVARVYLVPDEVLPARVNQHVCILRTTPELNPHYLYYFLINPITQKHLLSIAGIGGTRNALTKEILYNLIIEYPDYPTQQKIVKQLNAIKNKIIVLQNQNRTLEQMAQNIFKSWFVDFDGVTEFENSELGQIPKGWSVEKLSNCISVDKGLSYKGKFLSTSGIPLINLGNIEKNGGFIERKIKHYTGEFKTKHTISSRDIVIANTDITQDRLVLGSPALISPLDYKEIIFTHHIFAVRTNSNFKKYFLYYLLKTQNYHQHVISYATGTTVLAIPKEAVLDFQFTLPNDNLVNKFDNIASNMKELFFRNNSSIQSLTKTRDALLPKLMSGEIRV